MKTNVEVLETGSVKLTVTVEAAEIDARIKETYQDFAKKYKFPGFRPGKAPRQVIDNALGKEAARAVVTDSVVNELYPLAVDESGIFPVAQPEFDQPDDMVVEGQDFVFSATVAVKPEFELSNYGPVSIKVPFKEATDAEIDEQIEALGDYYFDYKNSPANTKVKADSTIELNMTAKNEKGEEISELAAEERMYELGQGLFPAVFDEALVGMKKGETKTVEVNVKENPCMLTAMLQDKAEVVSIEVEVKAVKKKVPVEFTDEWVKENLGVEDMAELRTRMGESIEQQKGEMIPRIMEGAALAELRERIEAELPEYLLEAAERDLLQGFFAQLQQQGMTFDGYLQAQNLTPEQFKEDIKLQAADSVKEELALDAWARNAGITVSEEELMAEFQNSGAEDPDALFAEWKAQGRLHVAREGIIRGKAVEAILEAAQVEEVALTELGKKDEE